VNITLHVTIGHELNIRNVALWSIEGTLNNTKGGSL